MNNKNRFTSAPCRFCKTVFTYKYSLEYTRRGFCSEGCRTEYHSAVSVCGYCEAEFKKVSSNQIYCSGTCGKLAFRTRLGKGLCKFCHTPNGVGADKVLPYCSFRCKVDGEKILHNCVTCDRDYKPATPNQKYCSSDCQSAMSTTTRITETPGRFRIFARDNFSCFYCGKTSADGSLLEVDHVYPMVRGGENDLFNLVTACHECNGSKNAHRLPDEKVLGIWERNETLNQAAGLDYKSLKAEFDRLYGSRLKSA